MTDQLDLTAALRRLRELSQLDSHGGGRYWDSVGRLLRSAHALQGHVNELQAELDLLKSPRPQVLMSLNMLRAAAYDVFDTPEDAEAWLCQPHSLLGDASPLQIASTLAGRQRVLEILIAAKYGLAL